jgi:hypothetical protein
MARVVMVEHFQDPDSTENIHVVFIQNKLTKYTNLFLRYLHYNITVDIPTCFGPQRTFIREENESYTTHNEISHFCIQLHYIV